MGLEPDKIKKAGNWVAVFLLGNTRELIARIDERTERLVKDMDAIRPKVDAMEPKVERLVKDMDSIRPKVDIMFPKMDILWRERVAPGGSPRQLNESGNKILVESGVNKIIEEKQGELLRLVKEGNVSNPYDAERTIELVVMGIPQRYPETVDALKNGAFLSGTNLETVLYVGSVHLRNLIFSELGFNIEDLNLRPES